MNSKTKNDPTRLLKSNLRAALDTQDGPFLSLMHAAGESEIAAAIVKTIIDRMQAAIDYVPNPGVSRDLNMLRGVLRNVNRSGSQISKAQDGLTNLWDLTA